MSKEFTDNIEDLMERMSAKATHIVKSCPDTPPPVPRKINLHAYVESEGILVHIAEGKEVPKCWTRADHLDQYYWG